MNHEKQQTFLENYCKQLVADETDDIDDLLASRVLNNKEHLYMLAKTKKMEWKNTNTFLRIIANEI